MKSHWCTCVGALLLGACGVDTQEQSTWTMRDLHDAADLFVSAIDSGAPPIADVREVIAVESGFLLVDAAPPHLRWYSSSGTPQAFAGGEGRGPNEFRSVWRAVAGDSLLWVGDGGEVVTWDARSRNEVDRRPLPRNTVALLTGCGGGLVVVFEGEPLDAREERIGDFGLAVVADTGWAQLQQMKPSYAPFTPTGLHFRPVALGDSAVVVFNHLREQLDVLHCSGGVTHIGMPEMRVDWHFPIAHGAIALDSQVVFLWSNPVGKRFDGTHGVLWEPEQGVQAKVLFEGHVILVGRSADAVFLVEEDMVPTTMRIPVDKFRKFFEQ